MLSSTGGYVKRSRVLGRRRDDTTLRSTLCPAMRAHGFCRAYMREASIRATLAVEKEEELRRGATELLALQEEVLCNGASSDEGPRTASIDNIVAEMKQEKAYENWSLDVAVEEHMASLRLRRCLYSHHREVLVALRRQKQESTSAREQELQKVNMKKQRKTSCSMGRRRVFNSLSPLQKCVACLLWQGCFEVPQKVVRHVRRNIEEEMLNGNGANVVDIEAEEQRVVTVTACRPSLGVVDLSSIPHIVAYVSRQNDNTVIRPETAVYFTGTNTVGIPQGMTEKQFDLSSSACAHELVEAIIWSLRLIEEETAQNQQQRVALRFLSLRRCAITNADALINALRKHGLDSTLLALDMSDNRLLSLRFLFALRVHFSNRLLRLSLANNPITRKPEYREQVRRSLLRLTSLDGSAIRRPPLSMPHPSSLSYTFLITLQNAQSRHVLSGSELEAVIDGLARFFYVWETRRVPWTLAELKYQQKQLRRQQGDHLSSKKQRHEKNGDEDEEKRKTRAANAQLPEEELDDDNFHHRYLHPSATFSMTVHEGLAFFEPDVMRLSTEVELDDGYVGMRLSPLDLRDLRVFDVSMKGNSRNLILGRSVLHRSARGSLNCYAAYKYSMYPQRLEVCHNLSGAIVSVTKITDTTTSRGASSKLNACETKVGNEGKQQQRRRQKERREETTYPSPAAAPFSTGIHARKPAFYIVTIHGVMSWRAPSMKRSECVLAAYDRVITFVENALPPSNPVEKRRSAPLLVFNDQVHFRPATRGQRACYVAQTDEQVTRLVVEYGLEACADGEGLVRAVVERASSDAATRAALHLLVFDFENMDTDDRGPMSQPLHNSSEESDGNDKSATDYFDICSLIAGVKMVPLNDDGNDEGDEETLTETVPHRVTLAQLDATVAAMNQKYTTSFAYAVVEK